MPAFEAALGFRPSFSTVASRAYRALGVGGYAGAGALVALLLLGFPVFFHVEASVDWILLGVLGLLGAVPAIDSAVALVNQEVTRRFGATQVPGLELRGEVPRHLRTLVVVPTLLTRPEAIIEQVERLEIHHLASIGGEIQFALLSDWPDAASETVEGDDALLQTAVEAIARLNRRHAPAPGGDRFLLLHRRRVWNESQRLWIGWERKRGKLHELNRLLRGARDTTFLSLDGRPPTVPEGVHYVITLDADTRLPPDTVRRLIGKMAHPLNQPVVDPARRRVVEGYAILQPRVTPNLPVGDEGSAYQRAFSSPNGIDPYSAAVSDVYQDLFGEGSYAGKGIYAVDAFETVLADRVPDSTLLSHDLFEGVFARAGLASDVEVVESYPARYDVASLRYHRWARGDWQLLPWILGWSALLGKSRRLPAKMPASGRWKMVDNLRRSVTPLTCVLALLAGWALPFEAALVWTLFFLGDDRASERVAGAGVGRGPSPGHPRPRALRQGPFRSWRRAHAGPADRDSARAPGLADGGRGHSNPVSTVHHPAQSPAMDAGGAGDHRSRSQPRRLLPVDGRRGRHRRGRARRDMAVRRPDRLSGRSFRSPVDRVTRRRALGEPAIERGGGACGEREPTGARSG